MSKSEQAIISAILSNKGIKNELSRQLDRAKLELSDSNGGPRWKSLRSQEINRLENQISFLESL